MVFKKKDEGYWYIEYELETDSRWKKEKEIFFNQWSFKKELDYLKLCVDVRNIKIKCEKCGKKYDIRYQKKWCPHDKLVKCKKCGQIYDPKQEHKHRKYLMGVTKYAK